MSAISEDKELSGVLSEFGEVCKTKLTEAGIMPWLIEQGFYECPAAAGHHGAEKGGLIAHSIMVTMSLVRLTRDLGLTWERPESPYLIGMLHDVCKLDDYRYWEENGEFKIEKRPDRKPGHGDKSVEMLKGHINLTKEEEECIRYHMGAFTDKSEWGAYTEATKKNQNVMWTHAADMYASQVLGV